MSDKSNDKKQRLAEISQLLINFCAEYLNEEYEYFCLNLANALSKKRKLEIRRGRAEQWAASIVYAIARLNFLFDKKNSDHITVDDICDFFDTKKSTTGNKATQIKKWCDVHYGREEYCIDEIRDMFTFYETEDGLIVPKSVVDREIDRLLASYGLLEENDEQKNEPELSIEEKRKIEKEKASQKAIERAEKKHIDENQLGLFE
jgi:hypothetical protein